MALTRDFKETIKARAQRDSAFRKELLREGVASLLGGDVDTAKTVLRDYINATIGFAELAHSTHLSPKSLMRTLSPTGNPYASNLFAILAYHQEEEGVRFEVKAKSAKAGAPGQDRTGNPTSETARFWVEHRFQRCAKAPESLP